MSAHRFFTIEMTLPYAALAVFEDQLAGLGLSISSFEKGAAPDPHRPAAEWVLQNLFDEPPDRLELESAIAEAAAAAAIAPPEVSFGDLPDGDWVGRTNKLFQPLRAGRFVLYGRHDRERVQRNRYALMVDAGQAFGTGRAPSTFGCLLALERLARRRGLGDVLDVGCGSGILGLAAARLGATTVIASDIDPIAVCVARENAAANALRYRVHTVQSDSL
jgi:ribosomal protein L11 methyltransferase